MLKHNKANRIYLLSLLLVAIFATGFVSAMGFLNYRSTAIELETQVIARLESETVDSLESALRFGKNFENYYGMEDMFASFSAQYPGPVPFVISSDGTLMYCSENQGDGNTDENRLSRRQIEEVLQSADFIKLLPNLGTMDGVVHAFGSRRMITKTIHNGEQLVGYFCCMYTESIFDAGFSSIIRTALILFAVFSAAECLAVFLFVRITRDPKWLAAHKRKSDRMAEKLISVVILTVSIVLLSGLSLYFYQADYMNRVRTSIKISLSDIEKKISHVEAQGVDLRDLDDLKDYISDRVQAMDMLHVVRVTERISEVQQTDEESNLISFSFGGKNGLMYLEAEISDQAMNRKLLSIILVLLSTMIILMIFVFELNNVVGLTTVAGTGDAGNPPQSSKAGTGVRLRENGSVSASRPAFSEKQMALALRFTGFLCATAECMCVPYAAMMIRAGGESLFGLSIGMTAALPLTLEGLTQLIGMLTLPRAVRRYGIRIVLALSGALMIACNLAAFLTGGALMIVICRTIAGFAYAGFKQVSNYLITRGYDTEAGRSDNISQDNAGLLAGSTCGAGLGAILSASSGYAVTFLYSAVIFAAYLLITLFLLPWQVLSERSALEEKREPIRPGAVRKMLLSPEMIFYILVVAIPLNVGVMLCVTLVPAFCQTRGISSIWLSYCYIANGLAGIYIGPALVSRAKARFGLGPSLAFAFALTAVGLFILNIPPIVIMLVISSTLLGFLDGFGTPMATDRFISLGVVRKAADESTALVFSVVLSFVLLTFAPMIAELLLMPETGGVSPILVGAAVYAVAAVLLLFVRQRRHGQKSHA